MTTCAHPILACGTGTKAGTPAVCRECKAYVFLPPARMHEGKWVAGGGATIAGMSLSSKRRMEIELDMGHAVALAEEGHWGARG